MSHLTKLQSITSLRELSNLLGYSPKGLAYILYKVPNESKYTSFSIPKKNGGSRKIEAPQPQLKLLQTRLASLILGCSEEKNYKTTAIKNYHASYASHGFSKEKSIFTNAKLHRNKKWVFNVDLEDFFGTINFGRVRGYFIHDERFRLHPTISTIIAQICCHDNKLPQGAPTSPLISNLIGNILDVKLIKIAKLNRCFYSRYADDITFSTNLNKLPENIAKKQSNDSGFWEVGEELNYTINACGFKVNNDKTRMQARNSRQSVTGLTVNKKVNSKLEYRKTARAMVHRLITTGTFDLNPQIKKGNPPKPSEKGSIDQLQGILSFIDFINQKSKQPSKSFITTYKKFLAFKELYYAEKTTIICEGKTDNVYLTHAILRLHEGFPTLSKLDDGQRTLNVRLFKYKNSRTNQVLGLHGGSGCLKGLINYYHNEFKSDSHPTPKHPVIIVVDNDSGSKEIYSLIKRITSKDFDRDTPFIHIFKNLYLVPTPLQGCPDSKIEDFFDNKTLSTKLGGKSFDSSNSYDKNTRYSKSDFAYKVIRPHSETIDFSSFSLILERITNAIENYSSLMNEENIEEQDILKEFGSK
jgi:hypothetical protein